jgi:flagellin-like hook-associated protein FlgL
MPVHSINVPGFDRQLYNLQKTHGLLKKNNEQLTTGKKTDLSTATGINRYFTANELRESSNIIEGDKSALTMGIQLAKITDTGVATIQQLMRHMKKVAENAIQYTDHSDRSAMGMKFNQMLYQASRAASDSDYLNTNLISHDKATSYNNDFALELSSSSEISLSGILVRGPETEPATTGKVSDGLLVTSHNNTISTAHILAYGTDGDPHEIDWTANDYKETLSAVVIEIDQAIESLASYRKQLGFDANFVQLKETFDEKQQQVLTQGEDQLTLLDLDEAAANTLSINISASISEQGLGMAFSNRNAMLGMLAKEMR